MKTRLKALRIPRTIGELLKATTKSSSSTGYENEGSGSAITELYYYETSGRLEGTDIFGVTYTAFVPYKATSRDIEKTDKIIIDSEEFMIVDLKKQIRSYIEDHYELILDKQNKPE